MGICMQFHQQRHLETAKRYHCLKLSFQSIEMAPNLTSTRKTSWETFSSQ